MHASLGSMTEAGRRLVGKIVSMAREKSWRRAESVCAGICALLYFL